MMGDIWLFGSIAVAALLHGISGMGFAMVTIAAMTGRYSLEFAITVLLLPTMAVNAGAWLLGGQGILHNFRYYLFHYWELALLSLIFATIGAGLLVWLPQAYLLLVLAVVVFFYAVTSLWGRPLVLSNTRKNMWLIGIAGGLIGGATNAMAPMMMMYLLSISTDKKTVIRVGNMCYFLGKLAQLVVLYGNFQRMDAAGWQAVAVTGILAMAGMSAGAWIGRWVSVQLFRKMILWILLFLGLRLGYYGLRMLGIF